MSDPWEQFQRRRSGAAKQIAEDARKDRLRWQVQGQTGKKRQRKKKLLLPRASAKHGKRHARTRELGCNSRDATSNLPWVAPPPLSSSSSFSSSSSTTTTFSSSYLLRTGSERVREQSGADSAAATAGWLKLPILPGTGTGGIERNPGERVRAKKAGRARGELDRRLPIRPQNGPTSANQGSHARRVSLGASSFSSSRTPLAARKLRPPGHQQRHHRSVSTPGAADKTKGFELAQTENGDWILNPKRKKNPNYGQPLTSEKVGLAEAPSNPDELATSSPSLLLLSPKSAAQAARLGVELEAFPLLQLHLIPLLPEGILVTSLRALLLLVPSAVSSTDLRTRLPSAEKGDPAERDGDSPYLPSGTDASPLEAFAAQQIEQIADELQRRHNKNIKLPKITDETTAESGKKLLQQGFKR